LEEPLNQAEDRRVHVLHKWRLVAWFWVAQAAFVVLFVPFWIMQGDSVNGHMGRPFGEWDRKRFWELFVDVQAWGTILGSIAALMALQAMLVWPVRRPRYRSERGWPLRLSIAVGALVGTALGVAMLFGLYTIAELREHRWSEAWEQAFVIGFWTWVGGSYIAGAILLHRFCSRRLSSGARHEELLGRIASTLFVGTLVEAAAIMPIDVMFRKRQDCYCLAGTFWAYVVLLAAGLVTLGPAVLLPVLTRRRKRWYGSRCDCCGYDMTGIMQSDRGIDRCPECGAGWRREPLVQAKESGVE
jgi:hypothetical protein